MTLNRQRKHITMTDVKKRILIKLKIYFSQRYPVKEEYRNTSDIIKLIKN